MIAIRSCRNLRHMEKKQVVALPCSQDGQERTTTIDGHYSDEGPMRRNEVTHKKVPFVGHRLLHGIVSRIIGPS